jgi:acyl carrier protein
MISDRLKAVVLRELRLDEFPIADATLASQVPGWDSLNHVRILSAIEKEFDIRFKSLEVLRLKNIGELQALVDRKLAAK